MAPRFVLFWAIVCLPAATCSREQEEEEGAALLQFSLSAAQHMQDGCRCCRPEDGTCCAYCLGDKGKGADKRICVTKTTEKNDARPSCDTCGGEYVVGQCENTTSVDNDGYVGFPNVELVPCNW
eukprot:CAMPEP_0113823288 /NCGR_PEP_ID=MMETSP0328-20130328/2667_1 /TAXON_ID=39455 /ORGANISM="Alexandrium minutum" /LENGTH=123 /DNA_ID=CAMNT_0000791227 /DNA_START=1 /DNA_END=369 /DNA_ORIENTATION=- /assembly_acc=CAM_ASM_000350